jgi:hypothetical protein
LLIGDSAGGQIVAVETGDAAKGGPGQVEIADQSVARGLGAEAKPVVLKADRAGKLTEVKVDALKHSSAALSDAPAPDAKNARGQPLRTDAITDIGFVHGQVLVAGLSNEEFSSSMRTFAHPFKSDGAKGASIEIYHGSHGKFETASPVRTFITYDIAGKPNLLAAYLRTPLVKIPVEQFQPGAKIRATTIAELGNMNRPLDMISYNKGGKDFILMTNSARGVMKFDTKNIAPMAPSNSASPTRRACRTK